MPILVVDCDVNGGVLLLRGAASHWPTGLRPGSVGCWSLARHMALMLVSADDCGDNGDVLSYCKARTTDTPADSASTR